MCGFWGYIHSYGEITVPWQQVCEVHNPCCWRFPPHDPDVETKHHKIITNY